MRILLALLHTAVKRLGLVLGFGALTSSCALPPSPPVVDPGAAIVRIGAAAVDDAQFDHWFVHVIADGELIRILSLEAGQVEEELALDQGQYTLAAHVQRCDEACEPIRTGGEETCRTMVVAVPDEPVRLEIVRRPDRACFWREADP